MKMRNFMSISKTIHQTHFVTKRNEHDNWNHVAVRPTPSTIQFRPIFEWNPKDTFCKSDQHPFFKSIDQVYGQRISCEALLRTRGAHCRLRLGKSDPIGILSGSLGIRRAGRDRVQRGCVSCEVTSRGGAWDYRCHGHQQVDTIATHGVLCYPCHGNSSIAYLNTNQSILILWFQLIQLK